MSSDAKKPSQERDQTDASLLVERLKTDQALAERQADVDDGADEIVRRARQDADAVLSTARDDADAELARASRPVAARVAVAKARVLEDEAVRDQRASADESLRQAREENARVLAQLLPLEREETDRYLLTERARADDALANRDDFLGIVSHDLRNLLGGIVMSTGMLAESAPENADGQRTKAATERIQRYAARMNRLIGDLVDVASIDAGKLAMTAVVSDPTPLIEEAVDMFRGAAAAKRISLESAIAKGPLTAAFDHERLLQVLANLITNAIKFTNAGGKIVVGCERDRDLVLFSVRDTGSGIPAGMLEAVFERFWQVGKNDRRGVGLGLYVSRCIVEAHGGKIWAESELGVGSTFTFTLRRSQQGS